MKMPDPELIIRDFAPGDEAAFRKLNEEWIVHYFALETERRTGPCRSAEKHIGQRRPGFFRRLQRADRRLLRPGRARRTRVRSGENGGYGICPGSRNRAAPAGEDHRRGSRIRRHPPLPGNQLHARARHPALRVDGFSPYPAGAHRSLRLRARRRLHGAVSRTVGANRGHHYRVFLTRPLQLRSIQHFHNRPIHGVCLRTNPRQENRRVLRRIVHRLRAQSFEAAAKRLFKQQLLVVRAE